MKCSIRFLRIIPGSESINIIHQNCERRKELIPTLTRPKSFSRVFAEDMPEA
jgi:hypothetical protein